MITARIETQVHTLPVRCESSREKAISALQDAVCKLTEEDGRCKFVVDENGHIVYHWFYQPTFRKEVKKVERKRTESPYILTSCIYILLSDKELCYENLYHEAENFNSTVEAHRFMKERGWNKCDYHIAHEYIVEDRTEDCIYGTGLGFTKAEAKEALNRNLKYYEIEVTKNGTIKNI